LCPCAGDDQYLEYVIAGKTWAIITEAYRHADQEKATDGPSSYPGQSRVVGAFDKSNFLSATEKSDYEHVAVLSMIAWARGMLAKVGFEGTSEPVDQHEIVISAGHEHAYPAYPARIYQGKLPELRPSVSIIPHSMDRKDFDVTRFGGTFEEPEKDDPDQLGAIRVGPLLVQPAPALKDCVENTLAGIHRHWQVTLHEETPLAWITAENQTTLEKLNSILGKYMGYVAAEDPGLHLASVKLPLKWGSKLQDAMWEYVEQDTPQTYKMIQKLKEIGLDPSKLPRMILNMGTRAAASNALFCCPTESVMHEGFSHLSLSHMSIEAQDERVNLFHQNMLRPMWVKGQKIYKTLVSTDNSKMDSTVCVHDRSRYVNTVRSLLSKIRDGIRTMRDPIAGLGSIDDKRKLFIVNKYLDLAMQAVDMGVGSGERITTGINRHTKILNQGFELVEKLGLELGLLVFRLWLLYEPGEHKPLTETEMNRIENGAYLRHSDATFDLGIGGGDDNLSVYCTLEPMFPQEASRDMVKVHAKCYKLLDPAFAMEFQDACEVFSRIHIPYADMHFPKPAKWLQKILLCHLNCDYDRETQFVRLGGAEYAQISTALLQRVYAARQLPLLRWLGLALAEMYADCARSLGWQTSVYTDDDRRKGLEDGDFVLQAMCNDMRDWLHGAVIDYEMVVKVLADGMTVADSTARDMALADADWAQMSITRGMILHRDLFEHHYPVAGDVRTLLGITEWTTPDPDNKLVNTSGEPTPAVGNATSHEDSGRTCTSSSPDGQQETPLETASAKPGLTVGRGECTVTGVEGTPAGTCHDSAASMHRGCSTKTTVMATVPCDMASEVHSSGATVVCGSGIPGPVIEPQEGQLQAQKPLLILADALAKASGSADTGGCQTSMTNPLVRTAAVGGLTDMLQGSPQSAAPGLTRDKKSKIVPCVLTVAPGSTDYEKWFYAVLVHLEKHGQKTAEQLIAEKVLPVIAKDGVHAEGKRRKFANRVLNAMKDTGTIASYNSSLSPMPMWFAVAKPAGSS